MSKAVINRGKGYKDFHLDRIMTDWYLKHLKEPILEVGCGNGALMEYLIERKFINICGIDINENLVSICQNKKMDVKFGNVLKLDYKDELFSTVICHQVFEHLSIEDQILAIKEINRVLKDDGIFVISVPAWNSSVAWDDYSHVHPYTSKSIRNLLEDFEFELKEMAFLPKGLPLFGILKMNNFKFVNKIPWILAQLKIRYWGYILVGQKKSV